MIDPDYMKNIPAPEKKSADYRMGGDEKPVGVPQTKKEFKTMLRKDHVQDDEEQKGKPTKPKEEEEDTAVEHTPTKKQKVQEPPSRDSIFTLSQKSAKKTAKEKKEPTVNEDGSNNEVDLAEEGEAKIADPKKQVHHKEAPKVAAFNPYAEKDEKLMSNVSEDEDDAKGDRTLVKSKSDKEKHLLNPLPPEKEDVAKFSPKLNQENSENVAVINPEAIPKPNTAETKSVKSEKSTQDRKLAEESVSIFTPYAFTERPKDKERVNAHFTQEQPDLSYVNPMNAGLHVAATPVASSSVEGPRSVIPPDVQRMMEHIIDKITTLSNDGKTDTTVTIRNLPLFDGANLKISSYDSARGEFNISFDNLKPDALAILQENQEGLRSSMLNKGFTVHILTMTTNEEIQPFTAEPQSFSRDRGFGGGGEQGQSGDEDKEEKE